MKHQLHRRGGVGSRFKPVEVTSESAGLALKFDQPHSFFPSLFNEILFFPLFLIIAEAGVKQLRASRSKKVSIELL